MSLLLSNYRLSRLRLASFRNYAELALDVPDTRFCVLTGANGAGKTNVLEAMSLLIPGRGLRGAALTDLEQQGNQSPWSVYAEVIQGDATIATSIATGREEGRVQRVVRLNGKPVRQQAELSKALQLLWLTPQMDRLFIDSSSERRRFFDRITYGFFPGHATQVNAYEKAMRERNRLLQQGGAAGWFAALEQRMAAACIAILHARAETLRMLNAALVEQTGGFPQAELALIGGGEGWLAAGSALESERRCAEHWEQHRDTDRMRGRTLQGPHRSDLQAVFALTGMQAVHCSTGEQKALLLSILLAAARAQGAYSGLLPVLLLDEVAAHLDEGRRASLFQSLQALGVQVFLTGTEAGLFDAIPGTPYRLRVEEGKCVEG